MFVHSQTAYAAIVAHAKDEHGGPPRLIYGELNEGAGISPLLQSTHLWTEPHNAIAAHQINRYNRAEIGEGGAAMQKTTDAIGDKAARSMRRS